MSTGDKNKILINVQNYSKEFKKFNMNNISFTVFEGTIHALVGRSGSGKSVLLKSIIGAIPESNYKGLITINGYKAGTAFSKKSLGYSLNVENFPQGLSAYNFLKFLGKTTIISESELIVNLERLLRNFGLWESRNKSLNSFSSGMKNQVMLIVALAHDPNLVILDEPGANLDSESRKFFISVLQDLKKQGKTILLTTHMIDETKDIIDNCTIIEYGELVYTGPIEKFGDSGQALLDQVNNLPDDQNITIQDLTNQFYKLIKENISNFGSELRNDPNLKSLFSGINVNEILKLNIEKSTIKKVKFDEWKSEGAFGIDDYNKNKYEIDAWNLLKSSLKLDLKWKDFDSNTLDREVSIDFFDINFINQNAKTEDVIEKVAETINDKLKDYIAETTLELKWNISKWWNSDDLKNNILQKRKEKLGPAFTATDKMKFHNYQLPNNNNNWSVTKETQAAFQSMGKDVFLNQSASHVKSVFTDNAKSYANIFKNKVDNWKYKDKITSDLTKVSLIGEFEINSWTYHNLTGRISNVDII